MNRALLGILAGAGLMFSASAHATLIGDFEGEAGFVISNGDGTCFESGGTFVAECEINLTGPNAMGGDRNIGVDPLNTGAANGIRVNVSGQGLAIGGSAGTPSEVFIAWDAAPPTDLTMGGFAQGITIEAAALNPATDPLITDDITLVFDLVSAADGALTSTLVIDLAVPLMDELLFFAFDDFNGGTATMDQFDDITSAMLTILLETDADITIEQIDTRVPEPATLGLLGAGLIGMGALARRRRRS